MLRVKAVGAALRRILPLRKGSRQRLRLEVIAKARHITDFFVAASVGGSGSLGDFASAMNCHRFPPCDRVFGLALLRAYIVSNELKAKPVSDKSAKAFNLDDFIPYLVNVLASRLNLDLARVYQWRVLAHFSASPRFLCATSTNARRWTR